MSSEMDPGQGGQSAEEAEGISSYPPVVAGPSTSHSAGENEGDDTSGKVDFHLVFDCQNTYQNVFGLGVLLVRAITPNTL